MQFERRSPLGQLVDFGLGSVEFTLSADHEDGLNRLLVFRLCFPVGIGQTEPRFRSFEKVRQVCQLRFECRQVDFRFRQREFQVCGEFQVGTSSGQRGLSLFRLCFSHPFRGDRLLQGEFRIAGNQPRDRLSLLDELVLDDQQLIDHTGRERCHTNRRGPWLDPARRLEQRSSSCLHFRQTHVDWHDRDQLTRQPEIPR